MTKYIFLVFLFTAKIALGANFSADNFLAYQSMQCFDNADRTKKVTIKAPTLGASWTLTLPTTDGNSNEFLQTNGSGVSTWAVPTDTGITQLTGDVTAGPGSGSQAATLATVNGNVGSFTNGSFTVNGKGLVTAASSGTDAGITQLTGDVTAGPGNGSQSSTLATVNGNVGSFTNGSFTVNGKGLITAASSGTAPVTSLTVASANGFAGTFTASTTPVLTLSTTVSGILSGNGTAISAASTTGSGSVVLATSPTITTPTIAKLANLTTNGITFTSAGDGTLGSGPLTGDITTSGLASTLATVNGNVGSFTNGSFTVNGKGLITAASSGTGGGSSVRAINGQTGTTYTFALTDGSGNGNNPLVTATNAAAQTYTVPTNASVAFPTGSEIQVQPLGAGLVTFAPASGVTFTDYGLVTDKLAGITSLIKTGTDAWAIGNNVVPSVVVTSFSGATKTACTDGSCDIYKFTSSGSLVIASVVGSPTGEVVVVAGGGSGGGGDSGGGGGAGGLAYQAARTLAAGTFTVTIGGGGSAPAAQNCGFAGSNSVYDTITAVGGGRGCDGTNGAGGAGGSGGGGGSAGNVNAGGAATQGNSGGATGFGSAGGSSTGSAAFGGGGGGGSTAVGANAVANVAGAGGAGSTYSTLSATCLAGGGGGGGRSGSTGGTATCGGGAGGSNAAGTAGTANTGGGGGAGGSGAGAGGAGGSGVVIIRVPR